MIRIPVTIPQLEAAIESERKGWFDRVKLRLIALRGVDDPEFENEWSDIKQVYIDLQHTKCAFCEKPLEGKIEQDVEHFRPKAAVAPWPLPKSLLAEIRAAGFHVVQPRRKGASERV